MTNIASFPLFSYPNVNLRENICNVITGAVRVISVVPGPRRSSEGAGASDKYKGLRSIVVPLEQSVIR